MNYRGKAVAVTGVRGFIGSALVKALEEAGAYVQIITGDIRDPESFSELSYEYDYLFHFAAPSSQVQFARDPKYCIETTIKGFINALEVCQKYGIKLIYPSTGLLSQNKFNEYAMCKKLCEDMARGTDALGLRIFATYGPGESHKRDYASVPYLFARDIVQGKQPIVFGDGSQSRDFIYIDDMINDILILAEECPDKIIDVGYGMSYSFNDLIDTINDILGIPKGMTGGIKPIYQEAPNKYVQETHANITRLRQFSQHKTNLHEGIKKLLESLK